MYINQVELLAPAGNKDAFIGAINAGADAVYLGGTKYSARAYADNFDTEDIIFCIRYAHLRNKKVYLTVNTLMKESEINELYEYILPLYKAGLDACIVQDFGAFQYLKVHFPQMELHASTQMTITGPYGAKMLKEMGATRIVPAREMSLAELENIKKESGLEIETFIHGAMCYCYSGQCLFSSILGGRSGNRGRCAQPCRLPYMVKPFSSNNTEMYPLSLKDMCTIEHMDKLIQAGIDSFKIEGRMKKPEYAAGVTAIYRKYIDQYYQNPNKPFTVDKKDLELLSKLYIRSEIQDGYYFKQNGPEMITLTSPAYSGSDDDILQNIRQRYISSLQKLPVSIYACFITGQKVSLTLVYNEHSVTVEGDIAEKAQNVPLSADSIKKQLLKLGESSFEASEIDIYTDEDCFYSLKAINELRRRAVKELEDCIIASYGLFSSRACELSKNHLLQPINSGDVSVPTTGWTISVSTKEQFLSVNKFVQENHVSIKRIYIESDLVLNDNSLLECFDDIEVVIALPYCMRHKDVSKINKLLELAIFQKTNGFLVRNIEEYSYLSEQKYNGKIYADAGIYIWNRYSLQFWFDHTDGITCPFELNKAEWHSLFKGQPFEKLIYGYIPMMVTANCVLKTTGQCRKDNISDIVALQDRYNKTFRVMNSCNYCYNIILNSVPVSLHKELSKSGNKYDKKICFTQESKEETMGILEFFLKNETNILTSPPYKEYTTGHEKRGVL